MNYVALHSVAYLPIGSTLERRAAPGEPIDDMAPLDVLTALEYGAIRPAVVEGVVFAEAHVKEVPLTDEEVRLAEEARILAEVDARQAAEDARILAEIEAEEDRLAADAARVQAEIDAQLAVQTAVEPVVVEEKPATVPTKTRGKGKSAAADQDEWN